MIMASVMCNFALNKIFFQFFGFLAMLAYGYDAFLKYRATTGIIVSQTTVTTVTVA